ncbi:MAG: TPM domain-containing protein [Bacteroidota bacterium]
MPRVEDFLTAKEEREIVAAIREAEKDTSGEIRVHLEAHTTKNYLERAKEIFYRLKMDNTKQANGVLIYIAVQDRNFAIYGDQSIHQVVPEGFWHSTRDTIQAAFKQGDFKQGIINGIRQAGKELKTHFPYQRGDVNELSDEISKG